MSSITISAITFVSLFGGALVGISIGSKLPKNHLDVDTKDAVKLAMALVGTIAAIALGLLISSAYSYSNHQTNELVHASVDVVTLGRLLQRYGPEANGVRESLRMNVERVLVENLQPEKPFSSEGPIGAVYDQLEVLTPKDDNQRMMKSEALGLLKSLSQIRGLMREESSTTVLRPLLFVMIFWLTGIFVSWGMFSPSNATTVTAFFVAALCSSAAILLIMGLYSPYSGFLRISSAPLRLAYESLGQ